MPKSTHKILKLRLDSNIIFYEELKQTEYELLDIFAVKGGLPITLNLGKWGIDSGIRFQISMNRWKRRTDLHGAPFVNGLFSKGNWADLIKDDNGTIIGTTGFFQEQLLYIIGGLNLTLKTVEYPKSAGRKLLANGTWEGSYGMVQRGEIDVDATGIGYNLQRASLLDFTIPSHSAASTLIAGRPEGMALDMWVYVRVFGVLQWSIFIVLIILLAMALSLITSTSKEESAFGMKRGNQRLHKLDSVASSTAMVFLFVLQMGSHLNGKLWASRVLTLTVSFITFLLFQYICVDITSEMTSGPPEIPIRNFEDVLKSDYRVIVDDGGYYRGVLARSKPGSAKHEVYKRDIENLEDMDDFQAFKEVVSDRKTLFFGGLSNALTSPAGKQFPGQLIGLNMDDSYWGMGGIPLLKGSEFVPLFNYYILKELEHGIQKRMYRKYHPEMFTNQQFSMLEPQPLGANNVLFLSTWLAFSICVSVGIAFAELTKKKFFSKKTSSAIEVKHENKMLPRPSQTVDKLAEIPGSPDIESIVIG